MKQLKWLIRAEQGRNKVSGRPGQPKQGISLGSRRDEVITIWPSHNVADNESGQSMNKISILFVLKVKKVKNGYWKFPHIGPKIWNSLPKSIRVGYITQL